MCISKDSAGQHVVLNTYELRLIIKTTQILYWVELLRMFINKLDVKRKQ
jgi:hypothetical protein